MRKKKTQYKVGERVVNEHLGAGEVVEILSGLGYSVMYDTTPDVHYNMGMNPALSFDWNLEAEVK